MKGSNKETVETFCRDVFVNHDMSHLDEYMRDDYIQHNDIAETGKQGFVDLFVKTFESLPDFTYDVHMTVADGDIVVVYSTMTATHSGEWLDQPPTGNQIKIDVVDIFRVKDGMISEHWDVADTLTLFSQMGAVTRPRYGIDKNDA